MSRTSVATRTRMVRLAILKGLAPAPVNPPIDAPEPTPVNRLREVFSREEVEDLAQSLFPDRAVTAIIVPDDDLADLIDRIEYLADSE